MSEPTYILGIETSCDETACAVVADGRDVLSSVVSSQIELHARFGGVVPEIASRAHIEAVNTVVDTALAESGIDRGGIAGVAVTNEPGLIGSLLVGLMTAKTIAWIWDVPLIAVNHIYAHAYAAALDGDPVEYPAVALVCSGGHTALYHCKSPTELDLLGSTIDDAAGEAFDKVAAILNLGYPGGPAIDKAAQGGDPKAVEFPRTLLMGQSLDFSFSGLKTAVLYYVNGVPGERRRPSRRSKFLQADRPRGIKNFSSGQVADIAASFQAAVVDVLGIKLTRAARKIGPKTLALGGGVAANSSLRGAATQLAEKLHCTLRMPEMPFCLDNAAMIAGLGSNYFDLEAHATVRR